MHGRRQNEMQGGKKKSKSMRYWSAASNTEIKQEILMLSYTSFQLEELCSPGTRI